MNGPAMNIPEAGAPPARSEPLIFLPRIAADTLIGAVGFDVICGGNAG